jgi:hypothetical protein
MKWMLSLMGMAASALVRPDDKRGTSGYGGTVPLPLGFDPASRLTFEETVAQMQRGYENTQRVVQFMDTKAAAVTAFSLAIFAFVGKIVAWLYDVSGPEMQATKLFTQCWLFYLLAVLLFAQLVAGFRCLDRTFKAVRPNKLPRPEHFTSLFPAIENAWQRPEAVNYLNRLVSGETKEFVLGEFKKQLLAMGGIIYLKIKCLQQSIRALWWQGLIAVLIGVVVGISVECGCLRMKVITKPVSAAATGRI